MDIELKDFAKTSATLTTNDKYIINTLSVMAMNARDKLLLSKEIAKVAIGNILKAQPSLKLPYFYVVDSIIKNVGSPYKEMFEDKIIQAFTNTFQSNKDHKIRIKLYNLRLTWKDHFSNNLMNDLDEQVKKLDPAWPLVTKFDPKSKYVETKKPDNVDNNSAKSSPDSTTPPVNRDPRIQKLALPEIKKERKRKSPDFEEKEGNSLFTIDRRGDNHIKKVVNKKGRLEETAPPCDSLTEGLFGTKDIDLRTTDDRVVPEKQWTSEDVFRMLKRKMQSNEPAGVHFDKPPPQIVINTGTPVLPPLPAPREPTWRVPIDGFPQLPNIGTDPRLLARCPFVDPFRTITIDGRKYLLYLDRIQPCIFVNNELHAVRFFCHDILELRIDNASFVISPNGVNNIKINRRFYIACLGGPGHELILNGWPHNVRIDGNIHQIVVDGFTVTAQFLIRRPVQVNVQRPIPPYVCEWAVKHLFGSSVYLHMPPLNPLKNPKLQDPQAKIFRAELSSTCRRPDTATERPPTTPANIDVHDLFQKLVANGIILPNKPADLNVDITKYNCDSFKIRNDKEIDDLHSGHQCDLCGIRFSAKDSNDFKIHMDYHFEKNASNVTSTRNSREYVGGSRQWILGGSQRANLRAYCLEEDEIDEETIREQKFRCPAFEDVQLNKCAICLEGFEMDWNAEEESHMLLNGLLTDGKVYHPICFENVDKQIQKTESATIDDGNIVEGCQSLVIPVVDESSQGNVPGPDSISDSIVPLVLVSEVSVEETSDDPISTRSTSSLDRQEFDYESVNTS